MDLKHDILVRPNGKCDFKERSDLGYFIGRVIRNWNVITILVTVLAWSFALYGQYFRIDTHIQDDYVHLSVNESRFLTDLEDHDVVERLTLLERRLAIVEKIMEMGYTDPDTINAIVQVLEESDTSKINETLVPLCDSEALDETTLCRR